MSEKVTSDQRSTHSLDVKEASELHELARSSILDVDYQHLEEAGDFLDAVKMAIERDHTMSFRESLRTSPQAFFWAITISFTIVMEGYDTFLLGNLIAYPSFAERFGTTITAEGTKIVDANWQTLLTALGSVGNVVGLIFMSFFADRMGHRKMILFGLTLLTGFAFMMFFAPNIHVLAASQALIGFPFGIFGILGSAYASEVAPLPARGFLTSFVNICWIIGQFVASGVLTGLVGNTTEWGYKIPFALQWMWIPPIAVLAYFAPDSPWWLIKKGRLQDAEKSIARLSSGSSPADNRRTLAMLVHTTNLERRNNQETSVWECFRGTNLRRTEIACMVLSAQVTSGEIFAYAATYFFIQAGLSPSDAYKMGFGSTALAFVATCASWVLMVWFGRRTIILWGMCAMTLDLLIIGCLSFSSASSATWAAAALCVVWLGLYSLTLGPQSFGLAAEISATRLRSQTIGLARMVYCAVFLVAVIIEPYLINPTAANLKGKTALVWFGIAVLTTVWCFFRMPETKGIAFAEMDVLFEQKVPAWRFKSDSKSVNVVRGEITGGA